MPTKPKGVGRGGDRGGGRPAEHRVAVEVNASITLQGRYGWTTRDAATGVALLSEGGDHEEAARINVTEITSALLSTPTDPLLDPALRRRRKAIQRATERARREFNAGREAAAVLVRSLENAAAVDPAAAVAAAKMIFGPGPCGADEERPGRACSCGETFLFCFSCGAWLLTTEDHACSLSRIAPRPLRGPHRHCDVCNWPAPETGIPWCEVVDHEGTRIFVPVAFSHLVGPVTRLSTLALKRQHLGWACYDHRLHERFWSVPQPSGWSDLLPALNRPEETRSPPRQRVSFDENHKLGEALAAEEQFHETEPRVVAAEQPADGAVDDDRDLDTIDRSWAGRRAAARATEGGVPGAGRPPPGPGEPLQGGEPVSRRDQVDVWLQVKRQREPTVPQSVTAWLLGHPGPGGEKAK